MSDVDDNKGKDNTITIIVNGQAHEVPTKEELTFDEVVDLAFNPRPMGENIVFTVTYQRGHGDKPQGTLVEGKTVKAKDGMVFDVTVTDKS